MGCRHLVAALSTLSVRNHVRAEFLSILNARKIAFEGLRLRF